MADSDTTQQVDMKKLLTEVDATFANCGLKLAEHVDIKKLHAEAKATLANCGLKLAEDHEKALAEAKRKAEDHEKALAKREARKKLLAEANALIANCRQKRAEREAKREDCKKLLAEATQHAGIQKLLDSSDAILANIQQKRADGEELDEAEWEEAIAEVKRLHREARKKLFANSQRTAELLSVGFLAASLAAKVLF